MRIENISGQAIVKLLLFLGQQKHHAFFLFVTCFSRNYWSADGEGYISPKEKNIEEYLLEYIIKNKLNLYERFPEDNDAELFMLVSSIAQLDSRE